jgi:Fe-S-cluster containining protein
MAKFMEALAALDASLVSLPRKPSASAYSALKRALDAHLPALHSAYDAYVYAILAADGRKISCARGCSACCRHYVSSVESFEIAAIHLAARERDDYGEILFASHSHASAYETLVREEGDDEEASDRALYRYYTRGRRCPFLTPQGDCGIYAVRPMACRMFFAESSPRFCEGKAIASPWNRNFQIGLPAAAEEALARCSRKLAHLELPEDLFPGLLAANERFGRHDGGGK